MFDDVAAIEVAVLLENSKSVSAVAGDVMIQEGTFGDGLYIISNGVFEVVKGVGENETVLGRLEEMSFFGEMSLVSNTTSATIRCVEAGRVTYLPKEGFQASLKVKDVTAFQVVLNMARMLADRLARTGAWIVLGSAGGE